MTNTKVFLHPQTRQPLGAQQPKNNVIAKPQKPETPKKEPTQKKPKAPKKDKEKLPKTTEKTSD